MPICSSCPTTSVIIVEGTADEAPQSPVCLRMLGKGGWSSQNPASDDLCSYQGRWVLAGSYADDAVARVPPFAEIELAIGRLFLPVIPSGDR